MRLFFYYTFHSFINTIKKVLKTWVAIMLACLVLGGLIGLGVGVLLPDSDKATAAPGYTPRSFWLPTSCSDNH